MNESFLILGIIVIFIVGVGVLLIWRRKRRRRRRTDKSSMADRPEDDLYAEDYFEDEDLLDLESVDQLDPLFDKPIFDKSIMDDSVQTSDTDIIDDSIKIPENEAITKTEDFPEADKKNIPASPSKEENPPAPQAKPAERKSEMIIALYLVAQRETGFVGADVLKLFEELGLKHGNMNIFHHYGIGELKVQQPLFSIANMVEPGTFNPQTMYKFTTPGLALFMRLPGPFGGRVAFELMLNNAQRLAEELEGTLQDERHTPLDQKKISALRERIANFEQRSSSLAMLKRFS